MAKIKDKIRKAINAFLNRDPPEQMIFNDVGYSTQIREFRPMIAPVNKQTIITGLINRVAIDCASLDIKHVKLDKDKRFKEELDTGLNNCLTLRANKDQTSKNLIDDIVESMLSEGAVAIVPIDYDTNDSNGELEDIYTMRTGKVTCWHADYVEMSVYNDRTGQRETLTKKKSEVSILINPFYSVMNEPNSLMKRLSRKIALLDYVDEQSSSGKLDLIIQLPYSIKNTARQNQAEQRRSDIEKQLNGSKYGIAYLDGTEKITQLNRPVDNNLAIQVEKLQTELFAQLGFTMSILDGTASENEMTNYFNRIVDAIMSEIKLGMIYSFIPESRRQKGESIIVYRDPFKFMSTSSIADSADKFIRNEIMTSNEIRVKLGLPPVNDKKADELVNPNIKQSNTQEIISEEPTKEDKENTNEGDGQNGKI